MLSLRGFEVMKVLVSGSISVEELRSRLNLSRSTMYDLLRDLREKGLIELRDGVVSVAGTTHARALVLAIEMSLLPNPRLLSDTPVRILLSAPRPLDIGQVMRLSLLSRSTFYRWFRSLVNEGWMEVLPYRMSVSYHLVNPESGPLHELLVGYHSHLASRFKVNGGIVVWTNGKQALVRNRTGWRGGTVTAFSAFPNFGVPVFLPEVREYALPKRELGPQEVFDHACLLADDYRLKGLCITFYNRNRPFLARHWAIEAVMRGEEVPGWPKKQGVVPNG